MDNTEKNHSVQPASSPTNSDELKISVIKQTVQNVLEKFEELSDQKNKLQEQMKILKHDLFDLKDGRLDRIVERQSLNSNSSVIKVTKCLTGNNSLSSWYVQWILSAQTEDNKTIEEKVTNSIVKTHAGGSYKLKNGVIRYL